MYRFITALFIVFAITSGAVAATPQWTVMVYMNGDNNLEASIVDDFKEMAKVGSSDDVKIVVQLDRYGARRDAITTPEWSDTYRFLVNQNEEPIPSNAVESLGEVNMVDGKELGRFVSWAMAKYPAQHYALIISGHGDGFRQFVPAPTAPSPVGPVPNLPEGTFDSPQRSISIDDTTNATGGSGDRLYVAEIADNLKSALKNGSATPHKLDLLGFDACFMGTIEVAYAMRNVANVLVASEEEERGSGWKYEGWLPTLEADPAMDAGGVANAILSGYATDLTAKDDESRTLAAIDLSKVQTLADSINALSVMIDGDISKYRNDVVVARSECSYFSPTGCSNLPCIFNIDLAHFMTRLAAHTADPDLRTKAQSVADAVSQSLAAPAYAGATRSGGGFGASGLSIYFPVSASHLTNDQLIGTTYSKNSTEPFPIAFVHDGKVAWSTFLHTLYDVAE